MSNTLLIIDGHYHCFKSFFALPSMRTTGGEPTSVVYGIAKLLDAIMQFKPDMLVFTFDSPGKTFRHDLYPEYKANRDAAPEEFSVQIPRVMELLEASNVPVLAQEGFEADDIIATLVHNFSDQEIEILIESRDKDLYQLIKDNVSLFTLAENKRFDAESLHEKWGISPEQVLDFLCLIGDSSDNIPGIPGYGPKTASKLLAEYGTAANLIKHIDDLKGAKKAKLADNIANLDISAPLVTLHSSVPVECDLAALQYASPDFAQLRDLYQVLEFDTLKQALPEDTSAPAAVRHETEYTFAESIADFSVCLDAMEKAPYFAIDLETTGLDPHFDRILGISLSCNHHKAWYIPWPDSGHASPLDQPEAFERLKALIENPNAPMAGQNIKFDYKFLIHNDLQPQGYCFDTMIASYLLNPGASRQHNLSALAVRILGHTMIELDEVAPHAAEGLFDVGGADIEKLSEYACEDADITLQLRDHLYPELEKAGLLDLLVDLEIPVALILARMELHGVFVDKDVFNTMSARLAEDIKILTAEIHELAGEEFNINSPKQLGVILFDKLELPTQRKTKTGYSTDEAVLNILAQMHPLPEKILENRSLTKLKNTYIDVLPGMVNTRTGRIHPEFNQVVTATGRLSSSSPNLQNIPVRTERSKKIREAFLAEREDHILLTADYSQIELRVLAHFSNDHHLVHSFQDNQDIHAVTASLLNSVDLDDVNTEMRYAAKAVNFGIIYGQGAYGLARSTGMSNKEAKEFIERYFETFPGIRDFIDSTVEAARETGEVRTILNRRRPVPELMSRNKNEQNAGQRIAVNTVIQGSAADLIKKAMVDIDAEIHKHKLNADCIMQIHDELVFEVLTAQREKLETIVKTGMEQALDLNVPLRVNIGNGRTWMEIH